MTCEVEYYNVTKSQMKEWEKVCRAYADSVNADLVFINEYSFGIQYREIGNVSHIYFDELISILKNKK